MQTPATPAAPATPDTRKSPEDRSQEFVAVEGGQDTASAEGLMVTAYIGMWAILMLFVYFSWRRQERFQTRIVQLEKALAKRAEAESGHAA